MFHKLLVNALASAVVEASEAGFLLRILAERNLR